jgi:hypothetical protein
VAFSRLTFDAQEEILARSSEDLYSALAPLNSGLASVVLQPTDLDEMARDAFSPERFAMRFHEAVALADSAPRLGFFSQRAFGVTKPIPASFFDRRLTSHFTPWNERPAGASFDVRLVVAPYCRLDPNAAHKESHQPHLHFHENSPDY